MRDAAYPAAAAAISHAKNPAGNADVVTTTHGELRSVWDGRTLYLLVEVSDDTPSFNLALPAWGASNATNFDGVEFALDFWNDKVDKFEDDDGLFTISRDGKLTYAPNNGVINHQSVHAFKDDREYTNRIKDFKVVSTPTGYTVELALQISGATLANGTKFGLDVMIGDSPADETPRTARVYWSHNDNASTREQPGPPDGLGRRHPRRLERHRPFRIQQLAPDGQNPLGRIQVTRERRVDRAERHRTPGRARQRPRHARPLPAPPPTPPPKP